MRPPAQLAPRPPALQPSSLKLANYLQGLSYSASTVAVPSLKFLPTSANASRSLHEVKRLNRKHCLRLTNLANACLLFAYSASPKHRKHPYLIWMCLTSAVGSYGVDFWFHRDAGFAAWAHGVVQDATCLCLGRGQPAKKEEDIVVVEAEEDVNVNVNGESVGREMDHERRMQRARAWFSGVALAMGIVGLWGDMA
jgi:autophagy-related protein 33